MGTFAEAFRDGLPPQVLQAVLHERFAEARFRDELKDDAFAYFVAEDREGFQGYAVLHPADAPVAAPAPAFELSRLYVRGDFHGAGLGPALMESCVAEASARGGRSLWLKVWMENPRARAFYRRWGFEARAREALEVAGVVLDHEVMVKGLEGVALG